MSNNNNNNSLYDKHAEEFSKTRTAPWNGWLELLSRGYIQPEEEYSILDLGCGNGRFLKFIQQNSNVKKYLGVDNSNLLLSQAKLAGGETLKLDINNTSWQLPKDEYNLIAAFGIQHHLSSFEIRSYFLKQIAENLNSNGIAVVTYWQFLNYERYKNKITKLESENDYLMSFGSNQNARFCHFTTLEEIERLEKSCGLQLVDSYLSDGRDNTENIYRIYKKA